jgi:hypothetical protein
VHQKNTGQIESPGAPAARERAREIIHYISQVYFNR